jgi:hypothetical protein
VEIMIELIHESHRAQPNSAMSSATGVKVLQVKKFS